jgi:oligopeptide transport system substrate-binding protein
MTYDKNGAVVPGAAESVKVSDDKKTYTFTIRKDARWHDGKAVTAADFEFTFKRLVDPAFASEYSFIATAAGIVNAGEVINKKLPKEQLGVKALDERTLEIKLQGPIPYLDSLLAFQVFYPVRKDLVEKFGDKFSIDPASIVGNGPFKLASWQKEQSLRIEKADTYWNAAAIKLHAIESPTMVKDAQANFNNFQTGGIDLATTSVPEIIKQAQDAKLKIQTYLTGCVDYMTFNTRAGRPFEVKGARLAVRDGISRQEYVNKIVGVPGYKPIYGIVPDYMPGSKAGSTYRKEAPLKGKDGDLKAVAEHLKGAKVKPFTILSGDSSRAKKYAEYWQNALAKLLSTEVKIESVPFKTRLQKQNDGDYDVALAGWCPDYRDAMTFMDLQTTKNENNVSGWSNKAYDALIEKAGAEADLEARVKAFAEAEKILFDEAPIVTEDQSGGAYVVAPKLTGVRRAAFGPDPDFRFAEWSSKTAH